MKRIIMICIILLISNYSYYGKVNEKGEKITGFENTIQDNVTQNEVTEEKQEETTNEANNVVEQKETVETEEIKQSTAKPEEKKEDTKSNKSSKVQPTIEKKNEQDKTSKVTEDTRQTEKNDKSDTQITNSNKQNQSTSTKQVDLSKYAYYEKATDGSYKAFMIDKTEIDKLKELIDSVIDNFGYKNIKVVEDSSLSRDGTMYFTANKTNVENLIYDSEGFTIYYYAIREYHISPNETENYFQTRSYIKVK